MRPLLAASFCGLLLAGCTVGPRFEPPKAATPAAWAGADKAAHSGITAEQIADSSWWTGFGDQELTSLIDRAATSNFGARQAVLRIEEARAQRQIVGAGAWPRLDAVAAYQDTRISERTATTSLLGALGGKGQGGVSGAIPGLKNPFETYQYGLTGSWEIDLFGRIRRQVEAAEADTLAAVEDSRAVQVALKAEVALAYIDLRSVQERHDLGLDNLDTARSLLRLAEDARKAGLGSDLDVANASAAVASAEAQLPPLERQAAADRNQLTLLLALHPGALDAELDTEKAVPPSPPKIPVGLPSDLARRRPDIRRAEAQLHAAVARQGVAVASLYPSVVLNATGGFQASDPANLAVWAARYMTVGPSLDLPVFDAGQRRANVRLQDVRSREAALAYAQTVLGALHEVEDAMAAYDRELARRAALQDAVDQSRKALALARERFQAGSVSFREVLDAQSQLQQADIALAASTGVAAEALVGLYKALGGGWEEGRAPGGAGTVG
jgi:multidrug efflux system outer membrane protein